MRRPRSSASPSSSSRGSTASTTATMSRCSAAAGKPSRPAQSVEPERLERAVRRAVLDRDEAGAYAPASFADRLDISAMFEGWSDIPADVRARLADWATDDYAASVRDDLEALKSGDPGAPGDRLHLSAAARGRAVIAAEEHVYVWPCDCRAIVGGCDKPVDVCLRFDNDRGLGQEVSRRARHRDPARDGRCRPHPHRLPGSSAGDTHAICNCCTDCCFPHRAAALLDRERLAAPPSPRRDRLAGSARSAAPAPNAARSTPSR